MAVQLDVKWARFDDGVLSFQTTPVDNIGGWEIVFDVRKSFGGTSGIIIKSVASGIVATSGSQASGISISDSGQGRYNVHILEADTSGLAYGNYAYTVERRDSGSRTLLQEGYMILYPSISDSP